MRAHHHIRLWSTLALVAALLLACQLGTQPRPRTQDVDIATQTAQHPDEGGAATPVSTPPLPPQPDAGPLPAPWLEIDLNERGDALNPLYPTGVALNAASGLAYVLSECTAAGQDSPVSCISTLDLETDTVRRTAIAVGSTYGAQIHLAGETLYLHHAWSGALHVLDRATLSVSETISDVYGLAYDGRETAYVVTVDGLARLGSDAQPEPVARKYDDAPVAMAANGDRVYILGYNTLHVYDVDLKPVATVPLEDGQLRALALDTAQGRLYVGNYDGLYVLDTLDNALSKTPADVLGVRQLAVAPSGDQLYALAYGQANWFGGTQVVAIDTETWETRTLLEVNRGQLPDLAYDEARGRLLVASQSDHALIPIDPASGEVSPRLAIGSQVIEVEVDAARDRIYATDSAGWVHVLDRRTYAPGVRKAIYGGQYISLDAVHGWLYAGDERIPQVTVYDVDTLQVAEHPDSGGTARTIPQSGIPRANPVTGEVVILNRRFYVYDGASGEQRPDLVPGIGVPADECPGCFYPISTGVVIDAQHGLTATTTYMPRPGKPGARESIAYDPASGRAYYALTTGGYVYYSSISIYSDLGQLQARAQPVHTLEGLSGTLALDPAVRRLYVTRGPYLYVLDSETLNRLGRIELDDRATFIAAVDHELGRLYVPHDSKLAVWTRSGGAPFEPLPHKAVTIEKTVTDIRPSPDYAADRTLLATIDGQLCRSTDGGETWVRLRGGLPDLGEFGLLLYAAFSPDYAQDSTIFTSIVLGDTHGEGVYRSTDGGETWHWASDGLYDLRVHRIHVSPGYARDGTLLAYARIQVGEALYRSTDRGDNWQLVVRQATYGTPPLPHPEEMFPGTTPRPQFRCDYDGNCERSADGGRTWDALDTGSFHMAHLADYTLSPQYDRDGTVYLLAENGVFRYDDRTGVAEIVADGPLYGPRDYTNSFTSIAAAEMDNGEHVLFIGANGGGFWRYPASALDWGRAWPLPDAPAQSPTPVPQPTPCVHETDPRFQMDTVDPPAPLGCATGPATETFLAIQPFELGLMFWRADARDIYALQQDGTWQAFADTWQESEPDRDPGLTPPEGLYQPVRGFGKVWRESLGGAAAGIGWATAEERGGPALAQPFANGLLLKDLSGVVYALYVDGTWASLR